MLKTVKSLTRNQKRAILLVVDLVLIPVALVFTFAIQVIPVPPRSTLEYLLPILPYLVATGAGISIWLGIPDVRLSAYEWRAVAKTAIFSVYLAFAAALFGWLFGLGIPPGLHIDFAMVFFLLSVASRAVMYQILLAIYRRDQLRCRVLIYGAGTTGMQLANALRGHETIEPVAFVDDNTVLQGLMISGLPVYTPVHIKDLVREKNIDRVLLAIPSLSQPKQAQLARSLQEMNLEVQTLPSFSQLIGEEPLIEKLTPLNATSFLQRPPVATDLNGSAKSYAEKVVLISGAGGSIGSELSRQVLFCKPARLLLYELSELALFTIEMELRPLAESLGVEIVPILGSVTDPRQVRNVLTKHEVQVILHAAAYKHVPLVEANPLAGLANNVLGTQTLAREAIDAGVERFILVSSDKAVRPTSVMGASKRLAEFVVQDLASRFADTVFGIVRFGNVLGSSGSVVPVFQDQIRRGGPVTVTHPDVERYFMTVHEAVHLVLRAGAMAKGGEVFVLDMGEPVKITRLARQVIESSGYTVRDANNPDGDVEIVFTGLRPGEKLKEELSVSENLITTKHPKIFCAEEDRLSEIEVAAALRRLRHAVTSGDIAEAADLISRWVEEIEPAREIAKS